MLCRCRAAVGHRARIGHERHLSHRLGAHSPRADLESFLAAGGILVAGSCRAARLWYVWRLMRRGGLLVEGHVGYPSYQATGSRFRGAVLALIGLTLFVLACVPGVKAW